MAVAINAPPGRDEERANALVRWRQTSGAIPAGCAAARGARQAGEFCLLPASSADGGPAFSGLLWLLSAPS
jgi:hypothetical protein